MGIMAVLAGVFPSASSAPIALIAHAVAQGSNGATTSGIDTTGANCIIVSVSDYGGDATAPSDSKGNTYTGLTLYNSPPGEASLRIWYCLNATVGSGHTVTFSRSGSYATLCVAAFSNVKTSSAFDQQNGPASWGATPRSTGSVTPTTNGQLLVTAISVNGSPISSVDGGFTVTDIGNFTGGVAEGGALAYLIQTTATAANPAWTFAGGTNAQVTVATFKSNA